MISIVANELASRISYNSRYNGVDNLLVRTDSHATYETVISLSDKRATRFSFDAYTGCIFIGPHTIGALGNEASAGLVTRITSQRAENRLGD